MTIHMIVESTYEDGSWYNRNVAAFLNKEKAEEHKEYLNTYVKKPFKTQEFEIHTIEVNTQE
jgi:hypothetical protein